MRTLHRDGLPSNSALTYAAILYLAGFVLHNADHLRRGINGITPEVLWVGLAGIAAAAVTMALIAMGHSLAPLAAAVFGTADALGVAAVHLLPRWSVFSDAFPGGNVTWISWVAALVEVVGALVLGAAGIYALRRGDFHNARPLTAGGSGS